MKKFINYVKNLRNLSISIKLFISTALFILLSVFSVTFFCYIQYTKNNEIQSSDKAQQIIEQVSLNINTYIDDLFKLSNSPYYYDNVIDLLQQNKHNSQMEQLTKDRYIESFLEQMMIMPRNDILRVIILTDDVYMSDRFNATIDNKTDFHKFDWYKKALSGEGPIFLTDHKEELIKYPKNLVFSIVSPLRNTKNTQNIIGVIKVDANFDGIKSICNKVNMGNNCGLYIIDSSNNVIYSSISKIPYESFYKKVKSSNKKYLKVKYNNSTYMLNNIAVPHSSWTIIAVNSLKEINKNATDTRNAAFFIAILCSFSAIIVLGIFIKLFLEPLLKIVKLMKNVETGNLSVRFPEKRHDEIGYLGSSFNTMVSKIKDMLNENTKLTQKVCEANYLQNEAQLKALFNQIKPHFIYNTLNLISLLVQCNRNEEAVKSINSLSNILRSITKLSKEVTVGYEINILENYLSIQSSRYSGKIEYEINIDKKIYPLIIPALILQPIVENAVVHGCEMKKEKSFINIYNNENDNNLIFIVQDNGIGMDPNQLSDIRKKLNSSDESDNKNGIGLINVDRRIKIKYGQNYGIKIDSILNKGTTVEIILPKFELKGEDINVQVDNSR